MLFIIIPAAIAAIGIGAATMAAREERRKKEEKQRQEKAKQAKEEAKKREDDQQRVGVANGFIKKHGLRITPERLVDLASRGEADLMKIMESKSRFAQELQDQRDSVRKLESKMKEVTDLITVVERRGA